MRKLFLSLLLAVAGVNAWPAINWTGALDTTKTDAMSVDTVFFGRTWNLTDGESIVLYVLADDGNNAGFSSDEINVEWGYQVGRLLKVSSSWDTAWGAQIVVDTIAGDGNIVCNGVDGSRYVTDLEYGTIDMSNGYVDTCSVDDFYYQEHSVTPPWGLYIRMWFKGLTGTSADNITVIGGKDQRGMTK